MLVKIISALMSVMVSLTGMNFVSPEAIADSFAELVFGVPYTSEAVERGFLDEINDADVQSVGEDSGFVKDKMMIFISSEISFFDKVKIINQTGGLLVGWCAPLELYVLSYIPMTFEQAQAKAAQLEAIEGVELASPVFTSKITSQYVPNDPFYYENEAIQVEQAWDELMPEGRNWWLEVIDARQAWAYEDYMDEIVTGICDSGFYLEHPELDGKISFPNAKSENRNIPDDHGTHVAGIVAAERDNSEGITGICGKSQLMCVDWSPDDLQLWIADVAILFGFSNLVKAGAKVINFSVGSSASLIGYTSTSLISRIESAIYSRSMASLLNKGYDFVVVQSAGNGNYFGEPIHAEENGLFCSINEDNAFTGSTGISADEILDRIIIVASVENNFDGTVSQSYFTNIGSTVSIAAPGTDIYSTTYWNEYDLLSGTSMSSPIVTAVASLVWSVNSEFSGAQVKDIVVNSYNSTAKPNAYAVEYYADGMYFEPEFCDYGVVNAKLSVEEALLRTYDDFGTVKGIYSGEEKAEYVTFNGKEYTAYSDGTFSFVAPQGSGTLAAYDAQGNEIASAEIAVIAGEETAAELN